jgi:hypothetical protein
MWRRWARRLALLLPIAGALAGPSCDEYGQRIYTARPYRAGAPCLDPSVPIGAVKAGELPATCGPRCLWVDTTLYVSTVCPPLPARARETMPDATPGSTRDPSSGPGIAPAGQCALALALYEAQVFCPLAPLDAGMLDGGLGDARAADP